MADHHHPSRCFAGTGARRRSTPLHLWRETIMKLLYLVVFLVLGSVAMAADTCIIAQQGAAAVPVVVAPGASPAVRATAKELAAMMERLGAVGVRVEDGDGSRGIVLGRPADFPKLPFAVPFTDDPFKREDYLLRTRATGVDR